MQKNDFLPKNDTGLAQFFKDLAVLMANPPAGFSIPATLQADMNAAGQKLITAIDDAAVKEAAHRASVAHKNQVKVQELAEFRVLVKSFKLLPNYTTAVGKAFNFVGTEHIVDYSTLKPAPKATKTIKGIAISYTKGATDGAIIYCRRGSETIFTRLEKVTLSSYTDTRPNLNNAAAEQRDYYLVYFKADQEIGIASDICTIKL